MFFCIRIEEVSGVSLSILFLTLESDSSKIKLKAGKNLDKRDS